MLSQTAAEEVAAPQQSEEYHEEESGRSSKRIKVEHEIIDEGSDEDDSSLDSSEEESYEIYSTFEKLRTAQALKEEADHLGATTNSPARPQNGDSASSTANLKVDLDMTVLRKDLKRLGPQEFLEKYVIEADYTIHEILLAFGVNVTPHLPDDVEDLDLLPLCSKFLRREYMRRDKLAHINTLQDIVAQLKKSRKVIVITGAGISTSLGIPDFRGENGIYSRLEKYQLSDPQELFDINLFKHDPSIFYDFCKELLPENRGYSPTHAFIRLLQDRGILLRQYTQNIDDVESTAGIHDDKLVQCHGSFKKASCLTCGRQVPGHHIFPAILAGEIPLCQACCSPAPKVDAQSKVEKASKRRNGRHGRKGGKRQEWEDDFSSSGYPQTDYEADEEERGAMGTVKGLMKPNITFFGEALDTTFRHHIQLDRTEIDLVLCIGTSLRVAPVADVPNMVPGHVPQAFISKEGPGHAYAFDVALLGACDEIVVTLAREAGWERELQALIELGRV